MAKATGEQAEQKRDVRASFDLTTNDGKMKAFNAQNGASISLKKLDDGAIIEVYGVMQYEDMVDSYGSPQETTITVLFGTDGYSYAGVSDTVAKAGEKLIAFLNDTKLDKINVRVVKQTSGAGREFLNIQLVG